MPNFLQAKFLMGIVNVKSLLYFELMVVSKQLENHTTDVINTFSLKIILYNIQDSTYVNNFIR